MFITLTQLLNTGRELPVKVSPFAIVMLEPIIRSADSKAESFASTRVYTGIYSKTVLEVFERMEEIEKMATACRDLEYRNASKQYQAGRERVSYAPQFGAQPYAEVDTVGTKPGELGGSLGVPKCPKCGEVFPLYCADEHCGLKTIEGAAIPPAPPVAYPKCNQVLHDLGQAYPRTCAECSLGPCKEKLIKAAESKL